MDSPIRSSVARQVIGRNGPLHERIKWISMPNHESEEPVKSCTFWPGFFYETYGDLIKDIDPSYNEFKAQICICFMNFRAKYKKMTPSFALVLKYDVFVICSLPSQSINENSASVKDFYECLEYFDKDEMHMKTSIGKAMQWLQISTSFSSKDNVPIFEISDVPQQIDTSKTSSILELEEQYDEVSASSASSVFTFSKHDGGLCKELFRDNAENDDEISWLKSNDNHDDIGILQNDSEPNQIKPAKIHSTPESYFSDEDTAKDVFGDTFFRSDTSFKMKSRHLSNELDFDTAKSDGVYKESYPRKNRKPYKYGQNRSMFHTRSS